MAILPEKSVLLYDADGTALAVQDGVAMPASTKGILAHGSDGTTARALRTADSGGLKVSAVSSRVIEGVGAASTPRIAGTAGAQNLATIANPTGSGKVLYIRRIKIAATISATNSTNYQYQLARTTAAVTAGGTVQDAQIVSGSATVAEIRSGAVTATAATGTLWRGPGLCGSSNPNWGLLELMAWDSSREEDDIELIDGTALLVSAEGNDTDLNHTVSFHWQQKAA